MAWLREKISKYEELIVYIIFGAMATVVDWGVYTLLYSFVQWPAWVSPWSATISKGTGWLVAMVFAFFTNKAFVFKSNNWSAEVVWPEFIKFAGCRIGSGLLDMCTIMVTVDILGWNPYIMPVISAVVVALINYFCTKILFQKK